MKTTHHELNNRFCHHPPNRTKNNVHQLIRTKFRDIAGGVVSLCPDTRETALALTKLEEAMFWANAAVARWKLEEPADHGISAGHVQFDQSPKEIAYEALQTVANIGSGEAQRQALIALRDIDRQVTELMEDD